MCRLTLIKRQVLAERTRNNPDLVAALEPWRLGKLDQAVTLAENQQRINKAVREDDHVDDPHNETGSWLIKGNQTLSALASVRSNIWTGPAVDLAARGYIAVYPTYGWWNKRPNLKGYEKSSNYALVATITTPETDIYTPVANAIQMPIVVET